MVTNNSMQGYYSPRALQQCMHSNSSIAFGIARDDVQKLPISLIHTKSSKSDRINNSHALRLALIGSNSRIT